MLNDGLLDSWRLSLHNKASRTVILYLAEVNRFARWLESEGRPAGSPGDLLAVTRQDAEAYFTALVDLGRAKATRRSRWIAMRSLYRWLVEEDELDRSPLDKVHVPKADPPPVGLVDAEGLERLLKACAGKAFNDRRDAALIAFLWATGLRVTEACTVLLADVDLTQRIALVHGKGDRTRLVRFDPRTAALIDRYKRVRARHRYATLPVLWLGYRGPLQRNGAGLVLDRRARAAGIDHVHPHMFRHTFADRWLTAGGSEGDLQRLGGWQNADVMRRYGAVRASDRALAAYDQVLGA